MGRDETLFVLHEGNRVVLTSLLGTLALLPETAGIAQQVKRIALKATTREARLETRPGESQELSEAVRQFVIDVCAPIPGPDE